jgi:hypothetical protein
VDITVVVSEIAIGVANTGVYTWAPDVSITTSNVEIIIADAKQVIVISQVFEIIIIQVSSLTLPVGLSVLIEVGYFN